MHRLRERHRAVCFAVIKGVLLRRPEVLGYNIDCLGDCAGECNRCWVRF